MKYNTFIGIDPGKSGAIVAIRSHNKDVTTYKMPMLDKKNYNMAYLLQVLKSLKTEEDNPIIILEDVHSVFGTSSRSNFQFGFGVGVVEMAIVASKLPFVKVQPKQWQKLCLQGVGILYKGKTTAGKDKVDTKGMATVAATRLFPDNLLHFGGKASKPHDGLVDALLLANYGKQTQQ